MAKADSLSRCPDHKKGVEHDNENVTLLKPEFFKVRAMMQGHLLIEGQESSASWLLTMTCTATKW